MADHPEITATGDGSGTALPPIDEGLVSAADDPQAMNAALVELANALGCDCELSDMLHRVDQLQASHEDVETMRDRLASREAQATDALRMLWLVVRTAGSPEGVGIDAADLLRTDWRDCVLERQDTLGGFGIRLRARIRGEDADKPRPLPESPRRKLASLLGCRARWSAIVEAIEDLQRRASRTIDRAGEVRITSALGVNDTQADVVEAVETASRTARSAEMTASMYGQLLQMLGAQDHQAAAARIGELAGLELLLNAGGAGRGVTAIAQERRRQIAGERFAPDADLQYTGGELAKAAACYVGLVARDASSEQTTCPPEWPWARCWWKPKDARSNLVRAGALIAAELDRMDRAHG